MSYFCLKKIGLDILEIFLMKCQSLFFEKKNISKCHAEIFNQCAKGNLFIYILNNLFIIFTQCGNTPNK